MTIVQLFITFFATAYILILIDTIVLEVKYAQEMRRVAKKWEALNEQIRSSLHEIEQELKEASGEK